MQSDEGRPIQSNEQRSPLALPETASGLATPEQIRLALAMLLESRQYARTVRRNIWEFAIEIERLRAAGLTHSGLRYLVCMRLAEQAVEVTPLKSRRRVFRKLQNLMMPDKTCFVATQLGEAVALEAKVNGANRSHLVNGVSTSTAEGTNNGECRTPQWRHDRRELCLGSVVVKRFKVPAPVQETILAAFEEEGWPCRIDDPLPPRDGIDPRRRLHDAISKLNQKQSDSLLHFRGDGTGCGVCWELKSTEIPAAS